MRVVETDAGEEFRGSGARAAMEVVLGVGGGAGEPTGAEACVAGAPGDRAVVGEIEIVALARASARELSVRLGVPMGDARRLAAAFELGRAVERARAPRGPLLGRPDAVARVVAPDLRGLAVETFVALLLDARHRLAARVEVSRGTLTSAPVHPREVFGPALRAGAAAVIVAHNHPSGDPEPSAADLEVTRRLASAGALVGVPLLDHLVWSSGGWVSLRERGVLRAEAPGESIPR